MGGALTQDQKQQKAHKAEAAMSSAGAIPRSQERECVFLCQNFLDLFMLH